MPAAAFLAVPQARIPENTARLADDMIPYTCKQVRRSTGSGSAARGAKKFALSRTSSAR